MLLSIPETRSLIYDFKIFQQTEKRNSFNKAKILE